MGRFRSFSRGAGGAHTLMADTAPSTAVLAEDRKQRVALISIGAAIGIFVFKLAVGVHTGSLGILAEAAHSALDLLATLLTWLSLRIAARPADANHPFGHGKFESFSAFLETVLLVGTAAVIGYTAVRQWMGGSAARVHIDVWAFAVMLTSIVVDWRRAAMLRRAAREFASDALAADALNFSSDLATSVAVLIGVALVAIGHHWQIAVLARADLIAAIVVAAAMIWLAVRLGRRTAGVLLDEAPPTLVRDLREALSGVEGVNELERLRLRRSGSRYFVDLQLGLEPASTMERVGAVREEVAARIHQRLPEADVVIETESRRQALPGMFEQVQAIARRHNLSIHDLSIYDLGSGLDVEFHLELPESVPLAGAHDRVSRLEAEMREQIPAIREIITHIEPELARVNSANLLNPRRVAAQLEQIARRWPQLIDCHQIQLRRTNGHLALSFHCSFPDALPIGQVHESVTRLEAEIKRKMPQLARVTIHPEPGSDNRR